MKQWRNFLAILLVLPACGLLRAQTLDLTAQAVQLTDLSKAKWRFHPGDDPRWADPSFDDSQWAVLAGNKSWDQQGYKRLSGIAWYRIHLKLRPDEPVAIAPRYIPDSVELFADGKKLGQQGSLSPGSVPLTPRNTWMLVAQLPRHPGEVVVALRVWHWSAWSMYRYGGFDGGPVLLGTPSEVEGRIARWRDTQLIDALPFLSICSIAILAGLLALLLYGKERSSPEYLWFGLLEVCTGLGPVLNFSAVRWIPVDVENRAGIAILIATVANVAMILFFFRFVGEPVRRWPLWMSIAQVPYFLFGFVFLEGYVLLGRVPAWTTVQTANDVLCYLTVLWLLFTHGRKSHAARSLVLPLLLLALTNLAAEIDFSLRTAGLTTWQFPPLLTHPIQLGYDDAARACFLAAMAYILVERFAETQAERTRLSGEFEAARTVQQVLIPDFLPAVAGLSIESAYLPAQEVGGDFFQVLTIPGGSDAFIILGDVSGKGLKAAMTVSLIVGTLRTLAEYVVSPGEILAGVNRRLYGRDAGFATCLVLKITPEGEVTIANAGHPNPYLDGVEASTESNLPLGLALEVEYVETRLQLQGAQCLTLVTDGVVEATAPATRELFGFERTQAISTQPAKAIAGAAQLFGHGAPQADDITVLTVRFGPAGSTDTLRWESAHV